MYAYYLTALVFDICPALFLFINNSFKKKKLTFLKIATSTSNFCEHTERSLNLFVFSEIFDPILFSVLGTNWTKSCSLGLLSKASVCLPANSKTPFNFRRNKSIALLTKQLNEKKYLMDFFYVRFILHYIQKLHKFRICYLLLLLLLWLLKVARRLSKISWFSQNE